MPTRPDNGWIITNHAVERYCERVVFCCDRESPNPDDVRKIIERQLLQFAETVVKGGVQLVPCGPKWRYSKQWRRVCEHPTHTFVIVDDVVVTTLGFNMWPSEDAQRRYAWMAADAKNKRFRATVRRLKDAGYGRWNFHIYNK